MPQPPGEFLCDAHQDLAYHCQEYGRDLERGGGAAACMITLPALERAGTRLICATLFTPHRQAEGERRYKLNCQLEMYAEWFARFRGRLLPVHNRRDLAALAQAKPYLSPEGIEARPIGVILLMEGLDLLASYAEIGTWFGRGVRMASLTWDGVNRFASGSFGDGRGLKEEGFRLLKEFERLGMILDLSHLCDASVEDALGAYRGPLCATHSNARELCAIERNLPDRYACEIAARGGVIGINLLAPLLVRGWRRGDALPSIETALAHTRHFAALIGQEYTGLGSDLDGGLDPLNTPAGIDRADHLPRLGQALGAEGWDAGAVAGFLGGNWWRFFERHLPA